MSARSIYLQLVGMIGAGILLLSPLLVMAAQAPDAGQTIEEHKQSSVELPQQQESKLNAAEPENLQGQESGEKISVAGFRFSGQDVVGEAELQKIVADSEGKELTLAQIRELAAQISNYFRIHGYIIARAYIPAQEVKDGIVEIAVIVGRYDQIIINRKNVAISEKVVRMELGDVKSSAYVKKDSLERAIWLVSDLSGIEVKASLVPGSLTGTSNLVLDLTPKGAPVSGSLETDNYGNRFTGQYEISDNTVFNNVTHHGDSFNLNCESAGSGFNSGSLSYQLPILAQGGKLELGYSRMKYKLGEDFADLGAHGTADIFNIAYDYTFKRSRTGDLYGQIGLTAKQLQDLMTDTPASDKSSNALTVMLNGDNFDNWGGANSYSVSYTTGQLDLNSADDKATDDATAKTAGSYGKLNFTLARRQYLSDHFTLISFANGQWAGKNLDSSEKISLGGANGVRAYPPGEALGDQGLLWSTELRWTHPAKEKTGENTDQKPGYIMQLVGFYDLGLAELDKDPWAGGTNQRTLQGAGLGLIWSKPGKAAIKTYYAWKIGSEEALSDKDAAGRIWVQGIFYY